MVAKPQILVVDDDQEMVLLLRDFLTRLGYEVSVANSGKGALKFFEKHQTHSPQLVLADIKMGPINGLELATALRAGQPNLPVILFSAYTTTGLAEAATLAGATRFVKKPFALSQIASVVKEELSKNGKKPKKVEKPS